MAETASVRSISFSIAGLDCLVLVVAAITHTPGHVPGSQRFADALKSGAAVSPSPLFWVPTPHPPFTSRIARTILTCPRSFSATSRARARPTHRP
jgi:hypothetical protein